MLSRRQLITRIPFAGLVFAAPLVLTSCNVFGDILAWTAVAGTAIDGIVAVLGPLVPPGGLVIIQAIKAFLTDLANAVAEYQSDTNPADKATLLAKIRTFLADIAANLNSFFQQITGTSPIIAVALGLAQVVLAAIMGFLGELPTPAAAARLSATLTAGGKTITITPKLYKTAGAFKSDYNSVATAAGHPEIAIK